MSNSHRVIIAAVAHAVLVPIAVVAAQSSVAVGPFLSMVPSASGNPLAGFSLTFGGTTGLAFRGSADMSIANTNNESNSTKKATGYRPWATDADAMLLLGGLGGGATVFSHSLAPYVFAGLGLTGGDSSGYNVVHNGWSYGAGTTIPLGLDADLFGEARWRMSEYVLPTAHLAPASKSELRFGLSFHVGGGRSSEPPPPRRSRWEYGDEEVAQASPPAPPPPPPPAPAPPPAQPQPTTNTSVTVNMPGSIVINPRWRRRHDLGITIARVVLPIVDEFLIP